ncbi:hypothetical protein ACV229_15300 [Burkholderia sp. MR1-5-21]
MKGNAQSGARVRRAKRHPRLSEANARLIARLIGEWPVGIPMTWSDVVGLASKHLHVQWSRQTLEKRQAIKDAYLQKFAERNGGDRAHGRRKASASDYTDHRISNLKAENEKLRERLLEYDRRLVRYVANALAHGLSEEQLNAPLRPVIEPHTPVRQSRLGQKISAIRGVAAKRQD